MSALDALLYGYRTILAATVEKAQRSKLNFSSAFTATDNATTSSTDIGLATTQTLTSATIAAIVLAIIRITSENNALAGTQNDVTVNSVTLVRVTDAGAVTWTGIAADSGIRLLLVQCVGAGGLTLSHANVGSVPINRFALKGGVDRVMVTNEVAILFYDVTQTRWICVA